MNTPYTIKQADVREYIAAYAGEPFHAVLCDPPYGLGFMNRTWDSTGIAYDPTFWASLKRVLYPGAFVFAFSSTRTYHRMASAAESAGLIIHPMIVYAFGMGFPKATQVRGGDPQQDSHWTQHRYGLQALKPALEPIMVAQVPYRGKPVACIQSTGAGAFNIGAGRIGTTQVGWHGRSARYEGGFKHGHAQPASGRWASNFILGHSADCDLETGACVEGCAVQVLGAQSGWRANGKGTVASSKNGMVYGSMKPFITQLVGDEGTAARYFYQTDWRAELAERLADAVPFFYTSKASPAEREAGLHHRTRRSVDDGRKSLIDNAYKYGEILRLNTHPTIKPIALTEYLARLLLPPDAYAPRRLFVPFAGSGSEMIGALRAGWESVQGVELEAEYVGIAQARLAWWQVRQWRKESKVRDQTYKTAGTVSDQLPLFGDEP